MAWATAQDVIKDWIGNDQPVKDETLDRWVARAERLLRREFPTLQERINSGAEPDLADTVKDVISSMVTRVFRNPQGIRTQQESTGQFVGSITFGGDQPGSLYLTKEERDALTPPGQRHKDGKAFTIPIGGEGSYGAHLPWCNLLFGSNICSCGADIGKRPIYENVGL